jgi:hypothetical protein
MRKLLRLIPLPMAVAAVIAFPAVASATVMPGTYIATVSFANAPQGTHFANGSTAPTCIVGTDLSIACGDGTAANQPYTLQGVGHTNATLNLVATYTSQIQCTNHGKQVVEAQQKTAGLPGGPQTLHSDKNGNMTVPAASLPAPPAPGTTPATNPCPNPNWTATVLSTTLTSFDYTLTFEGFNNPFIEITKTDP